MTESKEDNINIVINEHDEIDFIVSTTMSHLFLNLLNELENELENELLEYALRESEQMYKYLEKKNVKLEVESSFYSKIKTHFTECIICKQDFEKEDIVVNLNCNHIYHKVCINEWNKYKQECPICRLPIKHN
jgi:hypothetical protein